MNKYVNLFLMISFILLTYLIFQKNMQDSTTMKYFPIDNKLTFDDATTTLSYDEKNNYINWNSYSSSSEPTYLRQDVALIYENGIFKGMLSEWKNNTATIELEKSIPISTSSLLESITFHHGEIHQDDETITSIQKMSNDSLYVFTEGEEVHTFHQPKTKEDKKNQQELTNHMNSAMKKHLHSMLDYHHLSIDQYEVLPLTKLVTYEDSPLFNFSNETTSRIIGQFWEGFYNEYITLLMSYENNIPSHYMPYILIAKDKSHLLVLFEIDNESFKLKQSLSVN